MNTAQVLSAAYARIFEIDVSPSNCYDSQQIGDTVIDHASFEACYRPTLDFDPDTDYFECVVTDGSEGCWIDCYRIRYVGETKNYVRDLVALIKTLDSGRAAWKNMGALAGELSYVANRIAWELDRQS